MYVATKIIPEPGMSGFGNFGIATSEHNPFDEPDRGTVDETAPPPLDDEVFPSGEGGGGAGFDILAGTGMTAVALGTQFLTCLGRSDKAACAWGIVRDLIMGHPKAAEILQLITSSPCNTVLPMLGLSGTTVSMACGLGGGVWSQFQAKAAAALAELTGIVAPSRADIYEADYMRGRNRPVAEGGGHTLIDSSGAEYAVACPAVPRNLLYGEDGRCLGFSMDRPSQVEPGTPCPRGVDVSACVSSVAASRIIRAPLPPRVMLASGRIRGRVVGPDGTPIVGAEIRVGSLRNQPSGATDGSGAFDVPASATSGQRLYVTTLGFEAATVEGLNVTSGGTVDVGNVPMASAVPKTESGGSSTLLIVGGLAVVVGVGYLIWRSQKGG